MFEYLQGLHEGLCSWLCDRSQVVNEVGLGHTNSSVDQGQGSVCFVWDDFDFQILAAVQLCRVGQAFIADFVQSLRMQKVRFVMQSVYTADSPT